MLLPVLVEPPLASSLVKSLYVATALWTERILTHSTAWLDVDDVRSVFSSSSICADVCCSWKKDPVPDEQCFEAIKAGIDALPPGVKMFINGGTYFLSFSPPPHNL